MLLGIVSDTHGYVEFTRHAVGMLESFQVAEVIHCGDIGSPEIPAMFAPWPTHYVLGNCDRNRAELEEAVLAAGGTFHGRFGTLERDGRKIAFLHGDDERRLRESLHSGVFDLVCHGHTHEANEQRIGETLLLCPGAIYRANPHSIAIVELPQLEVNTVEI